MKKTLKLFVASMLAISANSAIAEPGTWYGGIGAGQSNYNDWSTDIIAFKDALGVVNFDGSQNTSSDDNEFGYKLFGGYRLHENIALELSYIDMGKVDARSSMSGTFYDTLDNTITGDLLASAKAGVDAFMLDVNLNVPMTSVIALIVKGGIYTADTKLTLRASGDIPGTDNYNYSRTDSSTGLHYGVGIDFRMTDAIGLRAEWERLDQVEANDVENDIDLLSVSLVYHF